MDYCRMEVNEVGIRVTLLCLDYGYRQSGSMYESQIGQLCMLHADEDCVLMY